MSRSRSRGNLCPICHEEITNDARMCRKHAEKFKAFLRKCYGNVKLGRRKGQHQSKAEVVRRTILDVLADGPFSTPEIAAVTGMTTEGARYACKILLDQGQVEKLDDGYRHIWTLAGEPSCDNALQGN